MQYTKNGIKPRIWPVFSALCVGIVLLAGLDWAASAATGQSLVLGHWNQADRTTTVKNADKGPALTLKAKKGPALAVNSDKRVKHLNADMVDGKSAGDLAASRQSIYLYNAASRVGGFDQLLPAQAPGSYLVAYSAQFVGAAGTSANPNTVSCHLVVASVTTGATKGVVAEAQVSSVETPPAVSGVGSLVLGTDDKVTLSCTMSRPNQQWSTSATQPIQVSFLHTDGSNVLVAALGRTAMRPLH